MVNQEENAMDAKLFENFDFAVLNSPEYKEDAVREDILTPVLKKLGYQPYGVNKMIRSKAIPHPFVYIGSTSNKIFIIPDYLLQVDNLNVLVIDAKSPKENIREGKNVQQVFSYAIHPDIRTNMYGLCNGREISIFSVSKKEPIGIFDVFTIDENWDQLYRTISPIALTNPSLLNYLPDYGLCCLKLGIANVDHCFYGIWIDSIIRMNDFEYTISSVCFDYQVSFDFTKNQLSEFLMHIPLNKREIVVRSLFCYPFKYSAESQEECFALDIRARIGKEIQSNENEDYLPLEVVDFM